LRENPWQWLGGVAAVAGIISIGYLIMSRLLYTDRFILGLAASLIGVLVGLAVAWRRANKEQSEKLKNFAEVAAVAVGGMVGTAFWLGPQSSNYFSPAHMTLSTSYSAVEHQQGCLVTMQLTMKNESTRTLTVMGLYQMTNAMSFNEPIEYSGMVVGPSDLDAPAETRDVNARYERRVLAPNETESWVRSVNYSAKTRASYRFGRLLTRIPFQRGMVPSGEVCRSKDGAGFRELGTEACVPLKKTLDEEGGHLTAVAIVDLQTCTVVQKAH
jgi:hypothetical protein